MVPMLGNDGCRWFECFNVMFRGLIDTLLLLLLRFRGWHTPYCYWIGSLLDYAWCGPMHHHLLARMDMVRDEREAYQYQGESEIC